MVRPVNPGGHRPPSVQEQESSKAVKEAAEKVSSRVATMAKLAHADYNMDKRTATLQPGAALPCAMNALKSASNTRSAG